MSKTNSERSFLRSGAAMAGTALIATMGAFLLAAQANAEGNGDSASTSVAVAAAAKPDPGKELFLD